MGAGPPTLSSLSVLHVAPPTRLPQNHWLAVAPRLSKWVTVAAPRVPLLILGKSRLCYHPRPSQGTKCQLQSGGEGVTALSDWSQCGIGIRASDHVVVIITARIW